MCGIAGVVNCSNVGIVESLGSIAHRGPDSSGFYEFEKGVLFHTRLSIVDLSENGSQPMVSDDGNFIMVFNGEIYNHADIRDELVRAGFRFKGRSDTETLLYGYIHYGKEILNKLNGIFSLAVLDKTNQTLFIARDQFGVKPLYYYYKNGSFAFSSEIKTFIRIPGFDKTLCYEALVNYINFLWSPGELTPFRYVKKMLQGCSITLDLSKPIDRVVPEKYYQILFNGKYLHENEDLLVQELDVHICKAVERQLMSDVPVGFFLSGGVDSSLVAAISQKMFKQPIECFTINSEKYSIEKEGFSSDLKYARMMAEKMGCRLHEVDGDLDLGPDFDRMIWHLDEPQSDPAAFYIYNISEAANALGIKVLLGGTAGDDIFSGYRRHIALNYEKYFKLMPGTLAKAGLGITSAFDTASPVNRRVRKVLNQLSKTTEQRMAGYFSWLPLNVNIGLFSQDIQRTLGAYTPDNILIDLLRDIPEEKSLLNKMLYLELNTFLPAHNLNYTDKMSMARGTEVRVPYLDKDLVEFSTKLPPSLKMKGGMTKYLLRKVSERYLPHDVIYRPKAGFGAPVREWVKNELKDIIHDRLEPGKIAARGIFDPKAVWKLIEDNQKGKIDASYTIWSLLAIESWMRQFYDGEQFPHSRIVMGQLQNSIKL
jgi:asparagine synthase (glutamine-hydrolysing)